MAEAQTSGSHEPLTKIIQEGEPRMAAPAGLFTAPERVEAKPAEPKAMAFHNWSLRDKRTGDFVALQAVGLVEVYIQFEAGELRPEAITHPVIAVVGRQFVQFLVQMDNGVIYEIMPGRASTSYDNFLLSTQPEPISAAPSDVEVAE